MDISKYYLGASDRAIVLPGLPADSTYRFSVQAYRRVAKDINPSGVILSPSVSTANYKPELMPRFMGDIQGTIQGRGSLLVVQNLEAISSDSILSTAEKPGLVTEYNSVVARYDAAINATTGTLVTPLATARSAAVTAKQNLDSYLNGLSPAWNDASQHTPINPANFQAAWAGMYTALSNFENAISTNLLRTLTLSSAGVLSYQPNTGGAPVTIGSINLAGSIVAQLTPDNANVFAYANGNVVNYDQAFGRFVITQGSTDISANFTLSTIDNPQGLQVSYTGNQFAITGGLDASEKFAKLTIRATGSGQYSGMVYEKVFTLSKIEGGYEIVSTLPTTGNFEGRIAFLTADDKLYRYTNGAGWTKNVDTGDLNGQVQYQQIGNGAVRLQHLLVQSNSLNPDPQFRDPELWYQEDVVSSAGDGQIGTKTVGWYVEEGAAALAVNESAVSNRFITLWEGRPGQNNVNNRFIVYADVNRNNKIPVSPNVVYELKAGSHNNSSQNVHVVVEFYDGSWIYKGNAALTWAPGQVGQKSTQVTPPAGTIWARLAFYNEGDNTYTGWTRFGNMTFREASGGTAIIDGSLTAVKLAAESVTTDKLSAGAVTAAKIAVTQLSAISATIGLLRTANSGARLEIENNQIRVYYANNALAMRIGVW